MEKYNGISRTKSSIDGRVKVTVFDETMKVYCNDKFMGEEKVEKDFVSFFNKVKFILVNKLSYIPISELDLQELAREVIKAI